MKNELAIKKIISKEIKKYLPYKKGTILDDIIKTCAKKIYKAAKLRR